MTILPKADDVHVPEPPPAVPPAAPVQGAEGSAAVDASALSQLVSPPRRRWFDAARFDRERLGARLRLITHFVAGQSAVQLLNIVGGILLLRWLDVESYAQFNVAFAFQSTIGVLVDLGFAGSIVALVGERSEDDRVIGNFVRSALHLRRRALVFGAVAALAVYPFVAGRQDWGFGTQVGLLGAVLAALAFQGLLAYSAVLMIRRQLRSHYHAQIVGAVTKLAGFALLLAFGLLSSVAAAWLSALSVGLVGVCYYRASRAFVVVPARSDPECDRQMMRYILPLVPGITFAAFQGQINVAIASVFGGAQNIAEVGALARLAQAFSILAAANPVLIEPYIASVPRARLLDRYLRVVVAQGLIAGAIAAAAFAFPEPLLWILGPNYKGLRWEVSLAVLTWCAWYFSSGMWTMNMARRWNYWWTNIAYIASVLATQAAGVALLDLSVTRNVIYLSLAVVIPSIFLYAVTGVYGFRYGPPPSVESRANGAAGAA